MLQYLTFDQPRHVVGEGEPLNHIHDNLAPTGHMYTPRVVRTRFSYNTVYWLDTPPTDRFYSANFNESFSIDTITLDNA